MDAYLDVAYQWMSNLIGPQSVIPWWAWVAALGMVFWGLLAPGLAAWKEPDRRPGLDRR
ncbi:hypothetical protein [Nucisporomicrobium flavum]|uniref:hypothetical protein n=1 Tax=Nucisporomicrobium flavum TaxID=2785915 RepID=UPI0018F5A05E|nr:hypothetical protein [Nucisporomicrobium flavum]